MIDNDSFCFLRLEIEKEMKIELGISPDDRSDDYLSYQTYESALRNALERFKS